MNVIVKDLYILRRVVGRFTVGVFVLVVGEGG